MVSREPDRSVEEPVKPEEFVLPFCCLHPPLSIETHPDPWPYFPDPLKVRK